jgi:apolipoprotein N-acyltransferase
LRAANSGISAVIDPLGRIVAELPLGKTGFLDVHPPRKLSRATIFYHYGNWPIFIFALAMLIISATFFCLRKRP